MHDEQWESEKTEVKAGETVLAAEKESSGKEEGGYEYKHLKEVKVRVSSEVQYDQNGMKASDYFDPENVPEDIKEAVMADREERGAVEPKHTKKTLLTPLGQPLAIFRHTKFTHEEDEVIATSLLAGVPLYLIAAKLHTSRSNLSKHIKESKLLSQAYEDRDEALIDHAEYQAKRRVDAGDPAMIMFWLERKGRLRGWGTQEIAKVEEDDSRIVIGEIPEGMLGAADAAVKEAEAEVGMRLDNAGHRAELGSPEDAATGKGPTPLPTPMEVAQTMEAYRRMDEEKAEKARQKENERERNRRESVEVQSESVAVSPNPPPPPSSQPSSTLAEGGGNSFGAGGGYGDYGGFGDAGGGDGGGRAPWDEGSGWEPYGF